MITEKMSGLSYWQPCISDMSNSMAITGKSDTKDSGSIELLGFIGN
jgi:hypothetical protein